MSSAPSLSAIFAIPHYEQRPAQSYDRTSVALGRGLEARNANQLQEKKFERSELSGKGEGVETLAVERVIIIAASANRRESSLPIHLDCRIAVANFKMDPGHAASARLVHEMIEQPPADALAVPFGLDRDQQQLGFLGDRAEQGEADRFRGLLSQAMFKATPAIGRMPASWDRVHASPNRVPKAQVMTSITESRSSDVPASIRIA